MAKKLIETMLKFHLLEKKHLMKIIHFKKRHFVPNRYIYCNQSNIEAMQDIYLLQNEFVVAKHKLLWFQIVAITLNDNICFK